MSTKNPPAFPRPHSRDANSGDRPRDVPEQDGMTLRDYFAGQALAAGIDSAFLYTAMSESQCALFITNAAVLAYRLADAMLEERVK